MNTRPLLLRLLPEKLRLSLAYRWYAPRARRYPELFAKAPLALPLGAEVAMYDLIPGDAISNPIAFTGTYELPFAKQLIALAQQGGIFVDVGANMGYFSLLWAACGAHNWVFSFEPDQRCLDLLHKNIAANGFGARVTISEKACSDTAGTLRFTQHDAVQSGWQGIASDHTAGATATVEATTLDTEFLRQDIQVRVLKIDTEGADTLVLRGARGLLCAHRIGYVFWEENRPRMRDLGLEPGEAQNLLRHCGYRVMPMGTDEFNWCALAPGSDLS